MCAASELNAALSFDAKCPFGFSTGYPAASLVNLADPYPIGGLAMLLVSSKHRCHRGRACGAPGFVLCGPPMRITARAVPNGDAPMQIGRRNARERLQNIVRDFFGTFGAAVCTLVPFRSHNGNGRAAGAFKKR